MHSWHTNLFSHLFCRAFPTCSLKNGVVIGFEKKCEDVKEAMKCAYQVLWIFLIKRKMKGKKGLAWKGEEQRR